MGGGLLRGNSAHPHRAQAVGRGVVEERACWQASLILKDCPRLGKTLRLNKRLR